MDILRKLFGTKPRPETQIECIFSISRGSLAVNRRQTTER
jgi:hypothetical protein